MAACDALEAAGIPCWIAPRDPVAGIPYARQLIDAINQSRLVVLILSEHANASEHVLRELEIATDSGIGLLPVRIQDVLPAGDLEYYIKRVHWFDATVPPFEDRVSELVKQTADLLSGASTTIAASTAVRKPLQSNLPSQITSFVGRERDVDAIVGCVRKGRLVTLSGAGGVGKTRCAIEAGRALLAEFGDGVWFVDLSTIRDPSEVITLLATTLGITAGGGGDPKQTLFAHLSSKQTLLILDNCEHLIDQVRDIATTVGKTCPDVSILATSREALNLYGEQLYRMPSLSVPPQDASLTPDELIAYGAVALFVERAAAANARFTLSPENAPHVCAICNRLEGIPLAIELAAARVKMIAPRQLAKGLEDRIGTLSGAGQRRLPRHQTLRAMFDWSYDLLSDPERVLLRRLGIFAGTFTVDVAAAVCEDEHLHSEDVFALFESLVDKSLVQAEAVGDDIRHRLLESIREFANAKLEEAGESAQLARAHGREYALLAESTYQDWDSSHDPTWLPQALSDLANFRSALKWSFGQGGEVISGQRIAAAIRAIWSRFDPVEGCRWIGEALDRVTAETPPEVVARLEVVKAQLSMVLADPRTALPAARHALELYSDYGNVQKIAEAQLFTGAACGLLGDLAEGKELLNDALNNFRSLGADRQIGSALQYLAILHLIGNETEAARSVFGEALLIFRATPGAERAARHMAVALAEVEFQSGDPVAALKLAQEALAEDRALNDDVLVVFDLCNIGAYLVALKRFDEAAATACDALALARRLRVDVCATVAFQRLAAVAALRPSSSNGSDARWQGIAAQLIGFVDARIATSGGRRDYTEQQEYEQTLERLSVALGENQLEALRMQGSKWTESEAAAIATKIREP